LQRTKIGSPNQSILWTIHLLRILKKMPDLVWTTGLHYCVPTSSSQCLIFSYS
jgi:hypothetical protein